MLTEWNKLSVVKSIYPSILQAFVSLDTSDKVLSETHKNTTILSPPVGFLSGKNWNTGLRGLRGAEDPCQLRMGHSGGFLEEGLGSVPGRTGRTWTRENGGRTSGQREGGIEGVDLGVGC